ncbi:MAG: hypothetical protein OSJ27_06605 [Candidatus Gastranaerophilales bacterium]|nr:hypothetical protein [Candidatus Gastranaerophilales bacterium]
MNEKRLEITEKLLEIRNSTYILKMALLNPDQKIKDTLPYGNFLSEIEHKMNSLNTALEDFFRTINQT